MPGHVLSGEGQDQGTDVKIKNDHRFINDEPRNFVDVLTVHFYLNRIKIYCSSSVT